MYLTNKVSSIAAACALLAAFAFPAQAATINDVYYGANDHGYGDRIGNSNYEITSADVTRAGNILTVSINTNFAGLGDNGLFASSTDTPAGQNKGIGYGDLFLAETWTPNGTLANNYITDNNSNGTKWLYGFSVADRWMAPGAGTGTLYSLNGTTNNANALLSDDFMSASTYRNGQEVAVDTASTDTTAIAGSSSWNVDEANKQVNFIIDLTGTSLESSGTIALHWAMTCANDTIEGSVVPVPAALWLMMSGLVGLTVVARRKRV